MASLPEHDVSGRILAAIGVIAAIAWGILAVAWFRQNAWAVRLWPWPEVPMTFVFLASIGAAIVAVWVVIGWTREVRPLAGVGANTAVVGSGLALHGVWHAGSGAPGLASRIGIGLLLLGFGIALLRWAHRQPLRDAEPAPRIVRASFVLFVAILIAVGSMLVAQRQVFPWELHPMSAPLVGITFLGAATGFLYAVVYPSWANAAPTLAGFLAYDLVLYVPYVRLLLADSAGADDLYGGASGAVNMTSLVVYLGVLAISTLVALYAFLVDPRTRWLRVRRRGA